MAASALRYRAFISYATADRAMGERFQRAIEYYRIPSPLRGTDRGFGPVPKRLTPLFRDRSDADIGGDLSETLEAALEKSDGLIVLCTPTAARSKWVNLEILRFKTLGRSARIIPVILDGSPRAFDADTAPDGALPPALFTRIEADGTVVQESEDDRLAADVRVQGDGFEFAKLKVVARLTGIPLTELTQRHLEAERRERRVVRTVAGVISTLSITAGTAAVIAYSAERTARERSIQAISIAARQIDEASGLSDRFGVPTTVVRELLAGADADFESISGNDWRLVPALDVQRGRLLALFANVFGKIGERQLQRDRAELALKTLDEVPVQRSLLAPRTWFAALPSRGDWTAAQLDALEALATALTDSESANDAHTDDRITRLLERGRDLADREGQDPARFWSQLAEFHYRRADLEPALAEQGQAIELLESQQRADPSTDRSILAYTLSRRAEFLLESERPGEALPDLQRALAILEPMAATAQHERSVLRSLGAALTHHADALYAACGSWTASFELHERAIEIFRRNRDSDPTRLDYAADLGVAIEHSGDSVLQTRNFVRARSLFDELLALRQELYARDSESADARRDLALSYERQGTLALAQGSRAALDWFDKALKTQAEGHADTGELDSVRRRDVAVFSSKAGKARAMFDRARPWESAHQTAIQIMMELVAQPAAPLGWSRDLAVFHMAYGDDLRPAGRVEPARQQWSLALRLIEAQLDKHKADPRLRADRALLRLKLGRQVDPSLSVAPALPAGCKAS